MKKTVRVIAVILAVMLCTFVFCACGSKASYVVSIEKAYSEGVDDYYTVTYSDGATETLKVSNGRDGESVDIDKVYTAYLATHPDVTYEDFLRTVLTVNVDSSVPVISKAMLSVAKVYSEFIEAYRVGFLGQVAYETAIYTGSAVIYSMDSDYTYLITNYHVVYDNAATSTDKLARKVSCYLYGSESKPAATAQKDENGCTVYEYGSYAIDCEFVGGAASADIALLRASTHDVLAVNDSASAVTFADGYSIGQTAIAIGNPENEGISVTKGIISVEDEFISLSVGGKTRKYRSIRIDTPLYSGNSGGGLFDADGKLVGITNAGDGTDQNVNYAIPLDIVKPVVANIMHYHDGTVKKLTLGVTVSSENSKYVLDPVTCKGRIVEDVVIAAVDSGTVAAAMNLTVGGVIKAVSINGTEHAVSRSFDISDILYTVRAGDEISVVYMSGAVRVESTAYTVTAADLAVVE